MKYRVWDTDIGKLLTVYDTEDEALALVRMLISAYGVESADAITMSTEHDDRTFDDPLFGAALAARAEEALAGPAPDRRGEVIASFQVGMSERDETLPMAAKGYHRAAPERRTVR